MISVSLKCLLVAVFLAAGLWSLSTALQCHFCTDAKNDQECNKAEMACGPNKLSCIVSLNMETGFLSKGCAYSSDCDAQQIHFKTKCCNGDFCNANLKVSDGSVVTHSCLLLLLGAVVALLHEMIP